MDENPKTLLAASNRQEVEQLLAKIPADDYGVWLKVGCALKRLEIPYQVFRDWSATSDKFDEDECAQKWEDLPDEPHAGWPTLRKCAGMSSFVPVPEQMLPEPQTEDECAAQAAHYLATSFKPGEFFELCAWKQGPGGRLVPDRQNDLKGFEENDTEDALRDDDTIRSWVRTASVGGFVVGLNPVDVPPDFQGYAPSDAMVTDGRFALLESDEIPTDEQWAKIKMMRLPIQSIVHSGHKSLHLKCRIDAGANGELYKARVAKLIEYVNRFGFRADTNCRNASRLTRLPGALRDGKRQYLVCGACGYPDWDTFEVCELATFNVTALPTASSAMGATPQVRQHDRATNAEAASAPEDQTLQVELANEFGEPLTFSSKGMVVGVNEPYWAAYVMRKRDLIKISGIIWRYAPTTGLWLRVSAEELNNQIAKTAREYGTAHSISELVTKFNEPTCNHIRKFMKSAEKDLFKDRPRNLIHVANGMVEPHDDETLDLKAFSPIYYSRNQSEIVYDPTAQCPIFKEKLLGPMLPQDDIEIIQRYGGQCLLGYNPTQTFLTLTGTAGGGKGTIVNIIRGIIGAVNCVELRTEHLGERFELARLIGKTFLIGSDVPSNFLLAKSAGKIKSLCGWDPLDAEVKGQTEPVPLVGNFNIAITANSRLKVNVDGDIDAWRRRMLWITFERPRPENPISDFAGVLLHEEGPGILNWMIEGAVKLLQNGFPRESLSSKRVERLLQESDSISGFLSTCIVNDDTGSDITVEELVSKYTSWCQSNDWDPILGFDARRKLTKGLETLYHVPQAHNVIRNGCNLRGYNGVAFKTDAS